MAKSKNNILLRLFSRRFLYNRKKLEVKNGIENKLPSDINEYLNINHKIEQSPKAVLEISRSDHEYIIQVKTVKDIWIALHKERKISVSGSIKFESAGKDPIAKSTKQAAFLSDGTATIPVNIYGSFILSNNSDATYNVVGICRSEDGVRSYLDNCNITILSNGSYSKPFDTKLDCAARADLSTNNNASVDIKVESSNFNNHKTLNGTGSNWTKSFNGKVVRSDSSWQYWRDRTFKRDNYRCVQCGSATNLTADHIQPLSLGGKNEIINLQTLCSDCHEDKHYCNFLDKNFNANDNYGSNYNPGKKIKAIVKAIDNKSRVRIDYVDRKSIKSSRTILPKKVYKGYYYKGATVCVNCVYVDAYCEKDRENRTFRLSRMISINDI